jgi:CTP:molybdopterin cytidylyltransferase MocA
VRHVLQQLLKDAGALLDAAGAAVAEVAVSEDGVLLDIDTPEALGALKATLPG